MVFGVVCGPYFNLNATTFKTAGHKKSECSTTKNDGGGQFSGDSEKVMEFQEVTPSCTLPISRKKQGDCAAFMRCCGRRAWA